MLFARRMNNDTNTVQRPVVRPVGGAEDQAVILLFLVVIPGVLAACEASNREQQAGNCNSRRGDGPWLLISHCSRRPRRRSRPILRFPLPRAGSVPAASW